MSSFADVIINQLERYAGEKKIGTKFSFILCPFHSESTPSGRIRHDPSKDGIGNFKCYGCGRRASWNEIAAALGLQQFKSAGETLDGSVPHIDTTRYKEQFLGTSTASNVEHEDLLMFDLSHSLAEELGLKDNQWRGYDIDWLREAVQARICYAVKAERHYLWLPVMINSEVKGYIKAQFHKPYSKKVPSYLNAPGSWSLTHGLFPFDLAVSTMRELNRKTMVLVEGPRDALRLVHFGIPAVCILGTHSWTDAKSRLLEFAGVERVVLMMDGDDAGRNATYLLTNGHYPESPEQKVFNGLESVFDLKTVRLWNFDVPEDFPEKAFDPGNMPTSLLRKVKANMLV
jgi:hypothetical protein